MRIYPPRVLHLPNSHKYWSSLTNGGSYKPISLWVLSLATCQSALNQSDATTVLKFPPKAGHNARGKNTVTSQQDTIF